MLGSRSDSEDSVKVAIGNVNTVLPVHRCVSHIWKEAKPEPRSTVHAPVLRRPESFGIGTRKEGDK